MDIDFITDLSSGFEIDIGENPQPISGNRAMLNRFEITFLTKTKTFLLGESPMIDNFGGNAQKFIDQPQILNDNQGITAAVSQAIEETVASMKRDEVEGSIGTERIAGAQLIDMTIVSDRVFVTIQVNPVEREPSAIIALNLPITRRD